MINNRVTSHYLGEKSITEKEKKVVKINHTVSIKSPRMS